MSEDQLQPQDTLDDRGVDDILDEGISPPERLRGSNLKDVTAAGELEGETIDERVAQEEPDVWDGLQDELDADVVDGPVGGEVGAERTGRLVASDDGSGNLREDDRFATDGGIDGAGASAEEAAMHTIEDDPQD
ncbi:MAG: DUF5709 domain-containing protein [Nocardioides alkalitolerans]|jgi:hypothetical protein